mgnify:CR=1 FL=1
MRLRPHTLGLGGGREDPRRREPEVMFGVWGGGRRGRGEAEAVNDRDPAATGKPLGSRRRHLGPHPRRTAARLEAGSAESSLRGTNGAPGAREEGGARTRNGRRAFGCRDSAKGTRRLAHVSGHIEAWEIPSTPVLKRGVHPESACDGVERNPRAATTRSAPCSHSHSRSWPRQSRIPGREAEFAGPSA